VIPLDDRSFERFNPDLAGRPQLIKGKTQILFQGMGRLSENSVVSIKNKSYSVTAEVEVPNTGANGVIIAQGGDTNGWSLYAKDGKLKHCYNFFGVNLYFAESAKAIPAGKHQVRMEFKYDGGGLAKGGNKDLRPAAPRGPPVLFVALPDGRLRSVAALLLLGDRSGAGIEGAPASDCVRGLGTKSPDQKTDETRTRGSE